MSKEYYEKYWKNELRGKFFLLPPEENDRYDLIHVERIKPHLKKEHKFLDVGCGYGNTCNYLSPYAECCGVDISETVIEKAKEKYPHIKFVCADVIDIPSAPRFFDFVCMVETVEHILDTEAMFEELNRILKVGGLLYITTSQITRLKATGMAMF